MSRPPRRPYHRALATPTAATAAVFLLLLLAAGGHRPLAAAVPYQVHATLEPSVIGLDETAVLTVEAQASGMESLHFTPSFSLENLVVVGGASEFEDMNYVNGSLSRAFRLSLRVRPIAVGPAHVRALSVRLRGDQVHLPDQDLTVQEQPTGHAANGAAPAGNGVPPGPADILERLMGGERQALREAAPQGPTVFLRAEVEPQRPVTGEQALYTIYLYTRQDIAGVSPTELPNFRGFWARDLPRPQEGRPAAEMVKFGNQTYGRWALMRKAIFALAPGQHVLEPAACDVVVEVPSRDFFGPLSRSEEVHLHTPQLLVDVQPLPPSPPGFAGVVGQVSLTAEMQPVSLHSGEGAAFTVTLAGSGNLQGVPPPHIEAPPGLRLFPPQQQSADHFAGTTMVGKRSWTYVLVADRPGRYAVRPAPVLYFDPGHREYRLAAAPAVSLDALAAPAAVAAAAPAAGAGGPATAANPAATGSGATTPALAADPAAAPSPAPAWRAVLARHWEGILGGLAVPCGVLAGMLIARRRNPLPPVFAAAGSSAASSGAAAAGSPFDSPIASPGAATASAFAGAPPPPSPPAGAATGALAGTLPAAALPPAGTAPPPAAAPSAAAFRSEVAAGTAELEAKLRQATLQEHPRQAAALVESGWRAFLGARWGLPATIDPARWSAALAAQGAPADAADATSRMVQEMHYLRYAPQLSATAAVRDELVAQSRRLLRRLR